MSAMVEAGLCSHCSDLPDKVVRSRVQQHQATHESPSRVQTTLARSARRREASHVCWAGTDFAEQTVGLSHLSSSHMEEPQVSIQRMS